jgi:hypothetical protein
MKKSIFFLLGLLLSFLLFVPYTYADAPYDYEGQCFTMDNYGSYYAGAFYTRSTQSGYCTDNPGRIFYQAGKMWICSDSADSSDSSQWDLAEYYIGESCTPESETCSNSVKDDDEEGIDCGGSCSDECIKGCSENYELTYYSDADGSLVYYCARETYVDIGTDCPDWTTLKVSSLGYCSDNESYTTADQDYYDSLTDVMNTDDAVMLTDAELEVYNYVNDNDEYSSSSSSTVVSTDSESGSVTTTTTETISYASGSYSTTSTEVVDNSDGSSTTTTTTSNYDSSGTLTGTASATTTTSSDGSSSSSSSADGDAAEDEETVVESEGDASDFAITEEDEMRNLTTFSDRWEVFITDVGESDFITSLDAFTDAIPDDPGSVVTTIDFGGYGTYAVDSSDYDDGLEIIGYILLICSCYVALRIIILGQ